MEATADLFARAGHAIVREGTDRGYRGRLAGLDAIEIAFLSASEIAQHLRDGSIDAGVTGEDLLRETIAPERDDISVALRLGFGPADVVVAVPQYWLDVAAMSDLDDVAEQIYRAHGRRLRIATKYRQLTRRFFAQHGVTGYRIVESAGATEGSPAAGLADVIVDITTTGSTLAANQLKILDDGVILRSTAVLAATRSVAIHPQFSQLVSNIEPLINS
jgi:ATP phosphoribosyltransferase